MPPEISNEIPEEQQQHQQQQQKGSTTIGTQKLESVVESNKENSGNQMTTEAPVLSPPELAVHKSIKGDRVETPLQHQTPSNESNQMIVPPPAPLSLRNRVVSLDRNQYIRNSSEEDDNSENDEVSSSDDGSYFSDLGNLPSPKSAARPRLGSWSGGIGNQGSLPPTGGRRTSSRTAVVPVAKLSVDILESFIFFGALINPTFGRLNYINRSKA
jgi:hypothetical protein